jgi:lysophospholipase L1-like esterase
MGILVLLALMLGLLMPPRAHAAQHPPVVVFFGDSLTQGLHASRPELSYRGILLERLAKTRDAGESTAVIQDPVGLLDDAQRRLPSVLAARPTLVFLELGHHEMWADEEQLDLFESRYADILDRIIASGADVIPSTLAWLGDTPGSFQYRAALRINGIIRRLAAERGLVVADLWTPTNLRQELISTPADVSHIDPYRGDFLHPNDLGHRVMADAFWKAYRTLRRHPERPVVF